MDQAESMSPSMVLLVLGSVVAFLICSIVICGVYCHGDEFNQEVDMIDHRDLLLREDLSDSVLEEGKTEWQCVVCLHMNHPNFAACNLCGASMEASIFSTTILHDHGQTAFLGDTVLLAPPSSNGSILNSSSNYTFNRGNASSMPLSRSSSADTMPHDDCTASVRQRALRYRRLNEMQLNQRQRGAQRRRLWQRVHLPNGVYVWVRTRDNPLSRGDSFIRKLKKRAAFNRSDSSSSTHSTGPPLTLSLRGTIAEQLHRKNAASMGYFTELNDAGLLSWKKADEVAIKVDADTKGVLEDLDVNLEGLICLPFREKKRWFVKKVADNSVHFTDAVHRITVRRDYLLEDSLAALCGPLTEMECREHLNVTFAGEPGLDAGGILREWFSLVCAELFSAEMGLFCTTHAENMSYWINPASGSVHENHLMYYKFAGRVFGKAILDGLVCDAHFALPLLKHLLGVPITFSDLEFLDEELYRNCVWMRENEGVDVLCVTFSVQTPEGDIVDLKPNGRDIDVTDENKAEYLSLVLQYRMLDSVSHQLTALLSGLYEIIPRSWLSVFDYQELDFFLCGLPVINMTDWKTHTNIRHHSKSQTSPGFAHENQVISWFWEVVESFSDEQKARLLQFSTGSSRVPVEGFKALMSASGYVHPFTIQLIAPGSPPVGLFPRAHTCFNRIDLPIYSSKEEMMNFVTLVIQMEITGFGFE